MANNRKSAEDILSSSIKSSKTRAPTSQEKTTSSQTQKPLPKNQSNGQRFSKPIPNKNTSKKSTTTPTSNIPGQNGGGRKTSQNSTSRRPLSSVVKSKGEGKVGNSSDKEASRQNSSLSNNSEHDRNKPKKTTTSVPSSKNEAKETRGGKNGMSPAVTSTTGKTTNKDSNKEQKNKEPIASDDKTNEQVDNVGSSQENNGEQDTVQSNNTLTPKGKSNPKGKRRKKKKQKKQRTFLGKTAIALIPVTVSVVAIVGAVGFGVYKDISVTKESDIAYKQGAEDATGTPDVESVIKIPDENLKGLITNAPGASFPANASLTNMELTGWTEPGGTIDEGKASLSMCYTGDGIDEPLKASAFLVSDNASAETPQWGADSVSVTGDSCKTENDNQQEERG